MKHFSSEEWIDYVRNLQTEPKSAEMKSHLDECKECKSAFQLWSEVAHTASDESDYAPPEDALRIARAQFSSLQPSKGLLEEVAQLLFDSSAQPAMAGIRSAGVICRQLLYRHGERFIDVRVERQTSRHEISLIGQVQEAETMRTPVVPVALYSSGRMIQHTETNTQGEFHLVFEPVEDLYLEIDTCEKRVRIKVPDLPV